MPPLSSSAVVRDVDDEPAVLAGAGQDEHPERQSAAQAHPERGDPLEGAGPGDLAERLEAADVHDVRAVGICLNTSALDRDAARRLCAETEARLGLPCTDPIAFGVEAIIDRILCLEPSKRATSVSH